MRGDASPSSVVNRAAVAGELVTSPESEDQPVCLKERDLVVVVCRFPTKCFVEMSGERDISDTERDKCYAPFQGLSVNYRFEKSRCGLDLAQRRVG